ncbi:PADRE domain [Dillenia turbinata]|uniref:PADRE domain n=1 Tax=Dillenia turbinata TaxID=194707 RepID=A0AAN8W4N1_9MAGN
MGICSSCATTSVAVSTAKLILQNGELQEFRDPVKVSQVLQKNPTSFICNSDDMNFDDYIIAVDGDEVLQPGQLYFLLPITWLDHPIQAEEMASLAYKASLALMSSGGEDCGCRGTGRSRRRTTTANLTHERRDDLKYVRLPASPSDGGSNGRGGGGGGGGGGLTKNGGRKFRSKLTVVLEE